LQEVRGGTGRSKSTGKDAPLSMKQNFAVGQVSNISNLLPSIKQIVPGIPPTYRQN
jgi:hypothetical protein